ncbi:MAG: alpha/beta hydrolase [Ahrensia sp.]|nr:alpha/beta hydrolase [Ahrensia sp.]
MTFVLVHGGWHGGWCWKEVAKRLRAEGHEVFTPTLTGLGERRHLIKAVEGPQTHVEDICNVLLFEELSDVVLVGHSYGGMIITGVASQMPDRIRTLVYVDAFVPDRDQLPASKMSTPERAAQMTAAIQDDDTITPNGFERWTDNSETLAWLKTMCTPHPASCFDKGVRLTGAEKQVGQRMFIKAGRNPLSPFDQFHERYRDDPQWRVHSVDALHDIMLDAPDELTRLLLETTR